MDGYNFRCAFSHVLQRHGETGSFPQTLQQTDGRPWSSSVPDLTLAVSSASSMAMARRKARKQKQAAKYAHRNTPSQRFATCKVQGHFRFLDLPAELRNRVYGYLFTAGEDVWLARDSASDRRKPASRLGLLQTCRQIHDEAEAMPYALNHLCVDGHALGHVVPPGSPSAHGQHARFLNSLTPTRYESITSLTIWTSKSCNMAALARFFRCLKSLPSLRFLHLGLEWWLCGVVRTAIEDKAFDFSLLSHGTLEAIEVSPRQTWFPMTASELENQLQAVIDKLQVTRKIAKAVRKAVEEGAFDRSVVSKSDRAFEGGKGTEPAAEMVLVKQAASTGDVQSVV